MKPPSIYKYFDSLLAIYDALFERGQRSHLEVLQTGMGDADPGLDALCEGLEAACRWAIAHPALAQLLFWRPVPSFEPTATAMAPSVEMVRIQREALAEATRQGQLGPGGDSDEAMHVVAIFVSGLVGQSMANEPGVAWGKGRFNSLFPTLMAALVALYPPEPLDPPPVRARR